MKTLLFAMSLALVTSAGIADDEGTNTPDQTNDPVHQEYQQPRQEQQQRLQNEQQPGQDEETRQKEDEKRQEQLLLELQKEGEDSNK